MPPLKKKSGEPICTPTSCDTFNLTVTLPAGYAAANPTHVVRILVGWPNTVNDFDCYVLAPDNSVVTSGASSSDPETMTLPAVSGSYRVITP